MYSYCSSVLIEMVYLGVWMECLVALFSDYILKHCYCEGEYLTKQISRLTQSIVLSVLS